jgi:hypothetical protein
VDCIVTAKENPTGAAKQGTNTIQIITTTVGTPLALDSLPAWHGPTSMLIAQNNKSNM